MKKPNRCVFREENPYLSASYNTLQNLHRQLRAIASQTESLMLCLETGNEVELRSQFCELRLQLNSGLADVAEFARKDFEISLKVSDKA